MTNDKCQIKTVNGNGNNHKPEVVVVIPCYNEEKTIGKVIIDFKRELPDARIIVYDNNSTDHSVKIAKEKGATVMKERKQGKGHVVRSMFTNIDADIYIMVDGDDTYPAEAVHELLKPVIENKADMTVGTRLEKATKKTLKPLHQFGNRLFLVLLRIFFKIKLKDFLSGYRVMTRDLVKTIPVLAMGFEIETELTLQTLERGFRIREIPITYRERPEGSHSKIRTFSDGYKIMFTIISLLRDYRPMTFFPLLALGFFILGGIAGVIVVKGYLATGLVNKMPTAILSITLVILGFISLIGGLIVGAINRKHEELVMFLSRKK